MSTIKVNRIENTATTDGGIDIDSNGKIGIGTSSPSSGKALTLNSSSNYYGINFQTAGTDIGNIIQESTGAFYISSKRSSGQLIFRSGAQSEAMRIDSSGRVMIGLSTGGTSPLNIEGIEGTAQLRIGNTNGAASDGDFVAGIDFHIKDNNDATGATCTSIRSIADQNHTATAKGTALAFHTTADDTTTLSERMRIDSAGNVGIGNTTCGSILDVRTGATGSQNAITMGYGRSANPTDAIHKISWASDDLVIQADTGNTITSNIIFKNDNTERMRIDSSGNLGIGTSSPRCKLEVSDGTSNTAGEAVNEAYIVGATTGSSEGILTIQSNNAMASDKGGSIAFGGRAGNSSSGANWAFINGYKENGTTANYGGYLSFATRPNSGAISERMRITSGGYVKAAYDGGFVSSTGSWHEFTGTTANGYSLKVHCDNASPASHYIAEFKFPATAPNNGNAKFIQCNDTSGAKINLDSDGGIHNYQSNDGNLCDEREKKNIVSLDTKWDKVKSWELRKFHYNEDADTDNLRYGVIAQQVEEHCPEVLTDWLKQRAEDAVLDEDGNVVTPAVPEVIRKGVKEQQMMWMAIKALQEAQTRIETLETQHASLLARVTALEAA